MFCLHPISRWMSIDIEKQARPSVGSQGVRVQTTHPIAHPRMYFWYLKSTFLRKYLLCNQGDGKGCLVRDQEAGGSNPLAPTNPFNHLRRPTDGLCRPGPGGRT